MLRIPMPEMAGKWVYAKQDAQIARDVRLQHDIVDDLIRERKENDGGDSDLLGAMLHTADPKTGEKACSSVNQCH